MEIICPCGTEKMYVECCQVFHKGALPKNALALMRSRYSAYVFHLVDYIIHTTHPNHPHFMKNYNQWVSQILFFSETSDFRKLEIINFHEDFDRAFVTFHAYIFQNGLDVSFIEKSEFEKCQKKWLYKNGIYLKS